MPEYAYVALSTSGEIEQGQVTCADMTTARRLVSGRQLRLVGIKKATSTQTLFGRASGFLRGRPIRSIRSIDVELLLQQLAVMIDSGLELCSSLRELSQYSTKKSVRRLCIQLATAIERGDSLAEAFAASNAFPPVVEQLARVGEETGELPTTLNTAAEFIEKRRQALGSIAAALAYPLVVAVAATGVAMYLVVFAIPKLAVFLQSMGRSLPAMTQSLLDMSNFVLVYGPQIAVLGTMFFISLVQLYCWRPARFRMDQGLLRVPIIGKLVQMSETQQLASSVALMLRSGVLLQDALATATTLHRNRFLAFHVAESRKRLAVGGELANSLRGSLGFGPLLSSMIAVGERTGDLPRSLQHAADFYAAQLDSSIRRLGKLVEPILILIVGGMVGYVYIAFFMALLSAGGNFK